MLSTSDCRIGIEQPSFRGNLGRVGRLCLYECLGECSPPIAEALPVIVRGLLLPLLRQRCLARGGAGRKGERG